MNIHRNIKSYILNRYSFCQLYLKTAGKCNGTGDKQGKNTANEAWGPKVRESDGEGNGWNTNPILYPESGLSRDLVTFFPFFSLFIPRSTHWQPLLALPATVVSPPQDFPSTRERTNSSVPKSAARRSLRAVGPPVTSSCTRRRSKVKPVPTPPSRPPEALLMATQRCSSQSIPSRLSARGTVQDRGQRAKAGPGNVARLRDPGWATEGGPRARGTVLKTFISVPCTEDPLGGSSYNGGEQ